MILTEQIRSVKRLTNVSVLIVDDDEAMTETLSDILEGLDYHVEIANSGYEAIEKVSASPFDVILMDIKMPGINGVDTFKKIKSIRSDAVVMMMTAYSVEELVTKALDEGAYGVMYKPLDFDRVIEFIRSVEKSALILVVDDDLNTCETLIDILEEKKYRVAKASNAVQAITRVKNNNYDVIFIDFIMPILNGLELYQVLRKFKPDIKAIMMTGYGLEVHDLAEEAAKKKRLCMHLQTL